MNYDVTPLERAFQLAKSGNCLSVDAIKKRLKAEGFSVAQVTGRTLNRQLNGLIKTANAQRDTAPDAIAEVIGSS